MGVHPRTAAEELPALQVMLRAVEFQAVNAEGWFTGARSSGMIPAQK